MKLLIENANQIVTCRTNGRKFSSGKFQSDVGLIENAGIYIENGIIRWIGKMSEVRSQKLEVRGQKIDLKRVSRIDASGKIIFPGFIDSHTHIVFAGDRANEFAMRTAGKTYEEIAQAGGGIVNTVSAVRKTPKAKLKSLAKQRVWNSISFGVTTIEVKSGYGLDTKNEIKMLEVINELDKEMPVDVYSTFLGAHAFPKEVSRKDYIDMILYEMIPQIAKRKLASFIDVFCEKNYYTPEETNRIFEQGIKFGLVPKLHTNQFHSVGGIETAVKNKAISVDHLEVMTDKEIALLKNKNIAACVLPGVSYFLNIPYAPARRFIDNNIPVAIATDFNPGSCMTENIQLVMSLAAQKMNLSVDEIINAVTVNAAASLGISNSVGSIEIGKQADLLIFDIPSYEYLIYHFGVNHLESVIKNGEMIFANSF